jgi:hypothetical protein
MEDGEVLFTVRGDCDQVESAKITTAGNREVQCAGVKVEYDIISGNEDGTFKLNSATGEFSVAARHQIDYETTPSYTITIGAFRRVLNPDGTEERQDSSQPMPPVVLKVTNLAERPFLDRLLAPDLTEKLKAVADGTSTDLVMLEVPIQAFPKTGGDGYSCAFGGNKDMWSVAIDLAKKACVLKLASKAAIDRIPVGTTSDDVELALVSKGSSIDNYNSKLSWAKCSLQTCGGAAKGVCVPTETGEVCDCKPGNLGTTCARAQPGYKNPCDENPCGELGTCHPIKAECGDVEAPWDDHICMCDPAIKRGSSAPARLAAGADFTGSDKHGCMAGPTCDEFKECPTGVLANSPDLTCNAFPELFPSIAGEKHCNSFKNAAAGRWEGKGGCTPSCGQGDKGTFDNCKGKTNDNDRPALVAQVTISTSKPVGPTPDPAKAVDDAKKAADDAAKAVKDCKDLFDAGGACSQTELDKLKEAETAAKDTLDKTKALAPSVLPDFPGGQAYPELKEMHDALEQAHTKWQNCEKFIGLDCTKDEEDYNTLLDCYNKMLEECGDAAEPTCVDLPECYFGPAVDGLLVALGAKGDKNGGGGGSSSDDSGLIIGIVVGILLLLILLAVVAFIMMRNGSDQAIPNGTMGRDASRNHRASTLPRQAVQHNAAFAGANGASKQQGMQAASNPMYGMGAGDVATYDEVGNPGMAGGAPDPNIAGASNPMYGMGAGNGAGTYDAVGNAGTPAGGGAGYFDVAPDAGGAGAAMYDSAAGGAPVAYLDVSPDQQQGVSNPMYGESGGSGV